MHTIDLNCDMGEGLANDGELMSFISSANIACGYHAGDEDTMKATVEMALEKGVAIGAHPGFEDKPNFGRKEIQLPLNEVFDLVTEQIYLLQKITRTKGGKLRHVKPHGALYNMSVRDALLANTIAKAVYTIEPSLLLFGLSGSYSISEAAKIGLKTVSEVFADRTYQPDGSLTPRSQPNAIIENADQSSQQVLQMIEEQMVTSTTGKQVPIIAETICLHGDGVQAVMFAKQVYLTLQQKSIDIQSI